MACMVGKKNAYGILEQIAWGPKKWDRCGWFDLAQDSYQRRAHVNTVMNSLIS